MFLEIENLGFFYGDFALRIPFLGLERGQLLSLLGPSGCGKSTLIQLISGLLPWERGKIYLNGKEITHAKPHKRSIGVVFQDLALFPHLNVYENIAFGLKMQKCKNIKPKVEELLKLTNLQGFAKRKVQELSGGEKQRVALARTLAPSPELILFDEPLSALDEYLRENLRLQIKELQQKTGFTAIFVTHDRQEAYFMGDILSVMSAGEIVAWGKPEQVFKQPASLEVAKFLGYDIFWVGRNCRSINGNLYRAFVEGKEIEFSGIEGCKEQVIIMGKTNELIFGENMSNRYRILERKDGILHTELGKIKTTRGEGDFFSFAPENLWALPFPHETEFLKKQLT